MQICDTLNLAYPSIWSLAVRVLFVTTAVALAGCQRSPAPSEPGPPAAPKKLTYDGATSISRRYLPLLAPALERRGVTLEIRTSGGGAGLAAMFAGQVEVAGLGRALTPEERARSPYTVIFGHDALAVWVHESNPVKDLSSAQVKALFTGTATRWKQVGGADRPVVTCTEPLDSKRSTLEAFQQLALAGQPYLKGQERPDPTDCLALVASDPGAVTVATVAYAIPGVRPVSIGGQYPDGASVRGSTYPLTRPLLLLARSAPQGAVRELFDLALSAEGQVAVERAGFVAAH